MAQKLAVGPLNKGLRNDVTAFNVDNDSFPTLINAYQWRGRVKRKRGTSLLGRLTRYFDSTSTSYNSGSTSITLDGSGFGNLITGFNLETNSNIVPTSVILTSSSTIVYVDIFINVFQSGILIVQGDPVQLQVGTINYNTGEIVITSEAGNTITAVFSYYPCLPVMGLEDLSLRPTLNPGTIAFDTKYAYNVVTSFPYPIYDITFYKNPGVSTLYPTYIKKSNTTGFNWNGETYQQFWTVNYQNAFWATNGVKVPFTITNIGMQYKFIVAVTVLTPTTANLEITAHGLVVGDFVFINEVDTTTGINFQTGYVTTVTDANNVIVKFPNATLASNGTGGIAQYLTNTSDITKDCIRFYDGDPTSGNSISPVLNQNNGWVNFCPPLSNMQYSIADLPPAQYYLVGARMIVPFKDRLCFLGPVIQTSAEGSSVYLPDTIIYSQNGTPYYTCSFTGDPTLATTVFTEMLVPDNQTATATAFFEDLTGYGGFITAGLDQTITTASYNEDVIVVGFFPSLQARVIYTGNDIIPFNFYVINSEYGSASTFSTINTDTGVITRGNRGFIITSQNATNRIDVPIPDEVFQIKLIDNGSERVCAQRDYINEWMYFTYPTNYTDYPYPTQTLQYNYRDDTWAIFKEAYTTYGLFRKQTGYTWATVGLIYPTWAQWNDPWNSGSSTLKQPEVIGGNQQGFILIKGEGTSEGNSLYIQSISGSTITSPDHCLNTGDFIDISDAYGTVSSFINNKTFQVGITTRNTFNIIPEIESGTYFGNGVIKRAYVPYIQTRQFPVSWEMGRKTRIGTQQYLLTTTDRSQIQLLIFLSQNSDNPYNTGSIVPNPNSINNSLIYSTVLYTCPESTNLGLTPANVNLQMPTGISQSQIWHRINTSLIGDTIQLGFTMSNEQMTSLIPFAPSSNIINITNAFTCNIICINNFEINYLVLIEGVVGMEELNGNIYNVLNAGPNVIVIACDTTGFGTYISGGTVTPVSNENKYAEIELHSFMMDVSPSQVLA